jgi:hypothetical protein
MKLTSPSTAAVIAEICASKPPALSIVIPKNPLFQNISQEFKALVGCVHKIKSDPKFRKEMADYADQNLRQKKV